MKNTPTPGLRGIYQGREPFIIPSTKIFVCHAIRSFTDLYARNTDVFETYYKTANLSEAEYAADKAADANIITLISPDGDKLYIPDTYITAFPNMEFVPYKRMAVMVDLGVLPDYVPVGLISAQIKDLVDVTIGCNSTVKIGVLPTTDAILPNDHNTAEAIRLGRINNTNTTYSRNLALIQQNQALQLQNDSLMQIIIDAGLMDDLPVE